jgi:hypothetical protein
MAGEPGHRVALPHSRIMIHAGSAGFRGATPDLEVQAREVLALRDMLEGLYHAPHRPPADKLRRDMERDNFMNPEDALAYGLIDRVVTPKAIGRFAGDDAVSTAAPRCGFCGRSAPRCATCSRARAASTSATAASSAPTSGCSARGRAPAAPGAAGADAARDQARARRLRDRAGGRQARAGRRRLPARAAPAAPRGGAGEVEHPDGRALGRRQDAARADAGEAAAGAVRHRRRHHPHRGRLRRRRRRERRAAAAAGRRLRRRRGRAGHHLRRRDRQDRAQERGPVHHPRRVGRGRAAGAAEDDRGHRLPRAAAGRPQAPAAGADRRRHVERALHHRRRLRGPRRHRPAPRRHHPRRLPARRRPTTTRWWPPPTSCPTTCARTA